MNCGAHALTISENVCMLPFSTTSMEERKGVEKQGIERTQHINPQNLVFVLSCLLFSLDSPFTVAMSF